MSIESLKLAYPWPAEVPAVSAERGPKWFSPSHAETLGEVLQLEGGIILELGSFLGRSTKWFCERFPTATVIAVDHWQGSPEHSTRPEWSRFLPVLYETFLVNCWPYRDRLIPIRKPTWQGMLDVYDHGVHPEVVYLNAAHDTVSVVEDLFMAANLFPRAKLIGDDFKWQSVQAGVRMVAEHKKWEVKVASTIWWIERN